MNNIKTILDTYKNEIDIILQNYSVKCSCNELEKAANYSLLNGGKRLRPILCREVYKLFCNIESEALNRFMCAMEFIHSFSLVHDDLPAIDNDDLRRGKATTHKVYGEAVAILAGDILLNSAMELVLNSEVTDYSKIIQASKVLFSATKDMIDGETIDVLGNIDDLDTLKKMYNLKTSRLIEASFEIGAILGNASESDIINMKNVGSYLGLAYQIQDDILDVFGDEKVLGKNIGSDENNNKFTFISYYGLEKSRDIVNDLSKKALEILSLYGDNAIFLQNLILYLVDREK